MKKFLSVKSEDNVTDIINSRYIVMFGKITATGTEVSVNDFYSLGTSSGLDNQV